MKTKTRFHKLTAWLLTMAMFMTIMPGFTLTASAADGNEATVFDSSQRYHIAKKVAEPEPVTEYPLWVGDTQVTSNKLTISGDTGTATYDPKENTLTLDNYTYTGEGYMWKGGNYNYGNAIYFDGCNTLNLVLNGTSSVTQQSATALYYSYGIYSTFSINVSGTGSLTVTGGEATYSYGVYVKGAIIVEGGSLSGYGGKTTSEHGQSHGVYAKGAITIESGSLSAYGGTAGHDSCGVFSIGAITVKGGNLSAYGGTTGNGSHGVYSSGAITVKGGNLSGNGGEATRYSYGVYAFDPITVEGGSLSGTGGTANNSYGVYAKGAITVNGGSLIGTGGRLIGTGGATGENGGSFGVYTIDIGRVTLNGGETVASGNTNAFYPEPTIADTFTNAVVWYGESEETANEQGAHDKSALADNYWQKYVRIVGASIEEIGIDGNKATATVFIPKAGTYTLIFADYEETRLNKVDSVTVTVKNDNTVITVPSNIEIILGKDDKIMLWQDMTNLVPLCKAYIVK